MFTRLTVASATSATTKRPTTLYYIYQKDYNGLYYFSPMSQDDTILRSQGFWYVKHQCYHNQLKFDVVFRSRSTILVPHGVATAGAEFLLRSARIFQPTNLDSDTRWRPLFILVISPMLPYPEVAALCYPYQCGP